MLLAYDNLNPDTAEVFFAVATVLAVVAAILYAVAARPAHVDADGRHPAHVAVWAPVLLSLAVASLALAYWVA